MKTLRKVVAAAVVAAAVMPTGVVAANTAQAAMSGDGKAPADAQGTTSADRSRGEAATQRKRIIDEAVAALAETKRALRYLDAGDRDKAVKALASAIGSLEVIIARQPQLALAPVDVRIITVEFGGTPDQARKAIARARKELAAGHVPAARVILDGLASEVIVRVVNIPLGTYPDALRAVVPLIDAGKIDEAKNALQAALSTLVLVDHPIPLPLVRAQEALDEAQKLAEKSARSETDTKRLNELLTDARQQLELAEVLGYGEPGELKSLRQTLSQIERRASGSGTEYGDLFERLRAGIKRLLSGGSTRESVQAQK